MFSIRPLPPRSTMTACIVPMQTQLLGEHDSSHMGCSCQLWRCHPQLACCPGPNPDKGKGRAPPVSSNERRQRLPTSDRALQPMHGHSPVAGVPRASCNFVAIYVLRPTTASECRTKLRVSTTLPKSSPADNLLTTLNTVPHRRVKMRGMRHRDIGRHRLISRNRTSAEPYIRNNLESAFQTSSPVGGIRRRIEHHTGTSGLAVAGPSCVPQVAKTASTGISVG